MAEWLGSALQKLLQRFESAGCLVFKATKAMSQCDVDIATSLVLRHPKANPTEGKIELVH